MTLRRSTRHALLPIALLVAGCLSSQTAPSPEPTAPTPPTGRPPASPPASRDWLTLFDGTSLSGLRAYGGTAGSNPLPPGRWEVADGMLRTIPGAGLDLITDTSFRDFELEFRWAVAPGGNSGVLFAVDEAAGPAWVTGPEYQLLDDAGHPDGRDPRTSAAALYGLLAPDPGRRLAPVGAWNDARIVAQDGRIEHWLDGRLVLAYDWDDPDLRAAIAASKFADLSGFMGERRGHIVFQHHGELAWFGRIRVRSLEDAP